MKHLLLAVIAALLLLFVAHGLVVLIEHPLDPSQRQLLRRFHRDMKTKAAFPTWK